MSPKIKEKTLQGSELVDQLKAEIEGVENEMRVALKEQEPGFSTRINDLLAQSRELALKLAGAVSSVAERQAALDEFDRIGNEYAKHRRGEDRMGLLLNRVLLLAAKIQSHENGSREKANDLHQEMNDFIREIQRENKPLYEQLSQQRTDVLETVASEMKTPAARQEIIGFPGLPEPLVFGLREFGASARRLKRQREDDEVTHKEYLNERKQQKTARLQQFEAELSAEMPELEE